MVWVNFKVFRLRGLFLVVLTEVEIIYHICNEPCNDSSVIVTNIVILIINIKSIFKI